MIHSIFLDEHPKIWVKYDPCGTKPKIFKKHRTQSQSTMEWNDYELKNDGPFNSRIDHLEGRHLNDVKTFTALGVYPTTVVTAHCPKCSRVASVKQLTLILWHNKSIWYLKEDIQHAKTGMLYSLKIVKVVARKVKESPVKPG